MDKTKLTHLFCLLMLLWSSATAAGNLPIVRLEAIPLPQMNIPRAGHSLFYANGELTAAGGHTGGFVPTPTAEYLKDGEWHQMQMVYNHDSGFHTVLRNGKVLLAGGSAEPIGIGQTFLAELYDPTTHTFDGFNSMEHKRTLASALELDSGRVVIAGNWYHQDGIEVFDYQQRHFHYLRDVSTPRAIPLILQTAPDDALIFGSVGYRGDTLTSAYAYQLKGDSLHIPLLETWRPLQTCRNASAIGKQGDYTCLFPVRNAEGQVAIAKYEKGGFALLTTACPVPMKALGHEIEYDFNILVDQQSQRAYLMGRNHDFHESPDKPIQYYILAIDYGQALKGRPAPLTLYCTQPLSVALDTPPVLTAEGNIVAAGGFMKGSNFTPSKDVWLFPLTADAEAAESPMSPWMWTAPLALLIMGMLGYLFIYRKKQQQPTHDDEQNGNMELMQQIRKLIESRRLYLDSELKVTDVAQALGVHRNIVSEAINSQMGITFNQFVNNYRVEHAKTLLREDPNMKKSSVSSASGFANEQSFFRTFKSVTGQTPKEWIQKID